MRRTPEDETNINISEFDPNDQSFWKVVKMAGLIYTNCFCFVLFFCFFRLHRLHAQNIYNKVVDFRSISRVNGMSEISLYA